MKYFSIAVLFLFFMLKGKAQENKTIVVNPVENNDEALTKSILQYPQFIKGKAIFGNGAIVEARFNYNYLTNQIVFIDPKGDSLALVFNEPSGKIVIEKDTFYFFDEYFIQQLTHTEKYKLLIKRSLKYTGTEKKGAYGTYSSTSSTKSMANVANDNRTIPLASDENILYKFSDTYYLSDRFNKFHPLTKKGVYDLFPKNERELRDFIKANAISFEVRADVEKLVQYLQTL